MLYRKRTALILLPALLCLGACSSQDLRDDADRADATNTAADRSDARIANELAELTSDRSEELSRRNGIESEADKHQP